MADNQTRKTIELRADEGITIQKSTDGKKLFISSNVTQVQSNWNQTDTSAVDYIKNKPSIPGAQVNADWNATSGMAQILNKPTIPAAQVNADWSESDSNQKSFIINKPDLSGYVRSDITQSFTDAEKIQARSNIGAQKAGPMVEYITWNGSDYIWTDINTAITDNKVPVIRYANYDWWPIDLQDDGRYVFFTSVGEGNTFGYAQIFENQEYAPRVDYRNAAGMSTYTYTAPPASQTNYFANIKSDFQRGIVVRLAYTYNNRTYYAYLDQACIGSQSSIDYMHFTFTPSVPVGDGKYIYEVIYTEQYVTQSYNHGLFDKEIYKPIGGFMKVDDIPDYSVTQDYDQFYRIGTIGFIRFGAYYATKSSTFGTCFKLRIDSLLAGDPHVSLPYSDSTTYYPMRLYNGAPTSNWTDTVTQGSGSAYIGGGNWAEVCFTIGVDSGGDQWQTSPNEFFTAEGWFRVTYNGQYWDYHYKLDKYNSTNIIYYKIECIGIGDLPNP